MEMAKLQELSDQEFDGFVAQHPYVVVDFWAEWCGPCKALDPIVEDLAVKYAGKVQFARVDADQNPTKIRQYGIMGIPTLLVFKGGTLVDTIVGAVPKAKLEVAIQRHL